MKRLNIYGIPLLILVCGAATMAQGATPGTTADSAKTTQLTLDDLRSFTDVFNQVRRNYVEEVDDKMLLEAAITGMLTELDPHSAYLPDKDFEDLENSSRGQYIGLGFDVAAEDGRVVVKQVISPSPADSAGIDPGDLITSVDGKPVKGRPLMDSIDDLSGLPGSEVVLTVMKPDESIHTLKLTREFIKVPALSFRLLDQRFGYYHLVYFHRDIASDLKQSLDSVQADGIKLQGLILDLRNNPGGVLQPAVEMADGFLDSGTIVTTRGRNSSMQMEFTAKPGQWLPEMPLVIIVDRGTASASEVLAGALQDNGRAVILGERTFGKGSVQSVLPLRNGAGIKLTTARYYTPSGRSIQAEGIQPDVWASGELQRVTGPDERKREADLERHLQNETGFHSEQAGQSTNVEEDYPLHEAVNLLRAVTVLSQSTQQPESAQ